MSEHHWTKQNRIRVVKYSSAEVSGPSDVPWLAGKLIIALDKIVLTRTSNSLVQNIFSSVSFENSIQRTKITLVMRVRPAKISI